MAIDERIRGASLALVAVLMAQALTVVITAPFETSSGNRRRSNAVGGRARRPAPIGAKVALADTSKAGIPKTDSLRTRVERPAPTSADDGTKLHAYEGLGSWVDLYNHGPWRNPSWTVRRMAGRGVRTIYLQTATYGSPAPVVYPRKVAEFIASAHKRDMTVVGWSVPSFVTPEKDFWRARAGVLFETGKGERFDSFALDIEADIVKNIYKRNRRLIELSDRIREVAGPGYPLGAIIPDPGHSLYWPGFPYKQVATRYDVMVPMGYFTFRTRGYGNVRQYTTKNIRVIRKEAGPETPIHVIGGIADDVGVPAARGFIRAIKDHDVLGASLYDFPITTERTWKELSAVPD